MVAQPTPALFAVAATDIDFAHHPAAHPIPGGGRHHLAHKFMSQNATKISIASGNMDISLADPGQNHADQGFPGLRLGPRNIAQFQFTVKG
jgi:hypothetical protein